MQSQDNFSFFRIGSFIYIKDLMPSPQGYLIICYQSDQNFQGEFFINVESSPQPLTKFIKDYLLYDSQNQLVFDRTNAASQKESGFATPLESNQSEI